MDQTKDDAAQNTSPISSSVTRSDLTGVGPAGAEMPSAENSQFQKLCAELERAREEIRVLKSAGAGAWP